MKSLTSLSRPMIKQERQEELTKRAVQLGQRIDQQFLIFKKEIQSVKRKESK